MLALAKKTDYVAYNLDTRVHHFMNGITDPLLNQAKLSLYANPDKYATDFDATIESPAGDSVPEYCCCWPVDWGIQDKGQEGTGS